MRAPFLVKAPAPRIRALTPGPARQPAPPSGGVFRDFVATLERLEKAKRRKPRAGGKAP
ncbi:hypothetical protein [Azorhizobium doebereinerae]|uniref:hypothetical protein n=1 Tax=Azorhizobium doebereinerae TaxID=281091 RepID=UPI0003FD3172|nr:hypothetical protein [Azorhizobium doebereinerae]